MQEKIDEYFRNCDETGKPYTVTGLALTIGCNSRETLLRYEQTEGYEEFYDTVKRAKLRVQSWLEENALKGKAQPVFSIFSMKNNFGWVDSQTVQHTGADGGGLKLIFEGFQRPALEQETIDIEVVDRLEEEKPLVEA
jgi:hypothetical protein